MNIIKEFYLRNLIYDVDFKLQDKILIAIKLGYTNRKPIMELARQMKYIDGDSSASFTEILRRKYLKYEKPQYSLLEKGEEIINEFLSKVPTELFEYDDLKAEIEKEGKTATLTANYLSGEKYYQFQKDGENGELKLYYKNGNLKFEEKTKNGVSVQYRKEYYENGKLKSEKYYNNDGFLQGDYKEYYENGKLKSEREYTNGKNISYYNEYYENGKIKKEEKYNRFGRCVDSSNEYYENGKLKSEKFYDNGFFTNYYNKYYPNGNLKSSVKHYQYPEKKILHYYPDGEKKREDVYGKPAGKKSSSMELLYSVDYKNDEDKKKELIKEEREKEKIKKKIEKIENQKDKIENKINIKNEKTLSEYEFNL